MIEGVRSFKISHSRSKSSWNAEIFMSKDSPIEWEFAKELHFHGFNIMLHYQGDWFEWYLDKAGKSAFGAMPLHKRDFGENRQCDQCDKVIRNDTPWCHRHHEIK